MMGSEIIYKNSLSSSLIVSSDKFSTLSNFDLTLILTSEQILRFSSLEINLIIKPDLKMKSQLLLQLEWLLYLLLLILNL